MYIRYINKCPKIKKQSPLSILDCCLDRASELCIQHAGAGGGGVGQSLECLLSMHGAPGSVHSTTFTVCAGIGPES
jgi:hypothetical protein